MNKKSVLLTICAGLFLALLFPETGHAAQIERTTDQRILIAAKIHGTAKAPATQLSNTRTTCAVTGKGRTRALCENHRLLGSGTIATEKSQFLSTVIITTVIVLLIVLTMLAALSLALIALAGWSRRPPRPPVERPGVSLSTLSLSAENRRVALSTRRLSVQQPWQKAASSSAAFRLVWIVSLVWFV
ncbi:MAG: hypothetical protein ACREJN_12870 [Nitrospiraceae bacterium]